MLLAVSPNFTLAEGRRSPQWLLTQKRAQKSFLSADFSIIASQEERRLRHVFAKT
jgi:hypothetical protein